MKTEHSRLLDRARKLLAMAEDTSSPNEAAIAAKRLQKLVDKHGLTIDEVEGSKPSDLGVDTHDRSFKGVPPVYIQTLGLGCGAFNDCRVSIFGNAEGRHVVGFAGFKLDVALSKMLMDYLIGEMERQLKLYKAQGFYASSRAAASAFRNGFADQVYVRLMRMAEERNEEQANSDGTSLVVVKSAKVDEMYGEQQTEARKYSPKDSNSYMVGHHAGKEVGLDKQIAQESSAGAIE